MKTKTTLTNKIKTASFNYLAFLASSLFLLSIAIFSLIWFQRQRNATDLINHTYQVKLNIEKCFGLLLEAESSQRGFLLTGDTSQLQNINHAEILLMVSLKELDSLVADNPEQLSNLATLRNLISSRLKRLREVLFNSDQYKNRNSSLSSTGKILMDSIHNHVRVMEAQENKLLSHRTVFKHRQDYYVASFIILFSILAFIILMWSLFKIKNENSLRLRAQLDANLLEKIVNERTSEINKINALLKSQNEMLARKNEDLTSFTYIASHDLKEPLRKIEMFINRIKQSDLHHLDEKSLEYFEKISLQSRRMQHLISSVLEYAQTDDESHDFKETDLNIIVNTALENLSEVIKEKNAVIVVDLLPTVNCIREQLEQVFTNLIDNAIKYSKPNETPYIRINASRISGVDDPDLELNEAWKIDFCDHGIGFDEVYKNKIFEIFQRLHIEDGYSGTGIGLAICKKIMENHRGSIYVKSKPGEGSIFSIILPINTTITKSFQVENQ